MKLLMPDIRKIENGRICTKLNHFTTLSQYQHQNVVAVLTSEYVLSVKHATNLHQNVHANKNGEPAG